jgi:hypothetical protein
MILVPSTIAASLLNATSRGKPHAAAVGVDHQLLGGHDLERAADAIGDERRRLHFLALDVDDTEPSWKGRRTP